MTMAISRHRPGLLPSQILAGTRATLLWITLGTGASPVAAENTGVFGPEQYAREAGPPQTFTAAFPHCGTAACQLLVTNGNADGSSRVSSASVSINGEEIVGRRDFNQQVAEIERPVSLIDQNSITTQLASKPGSFITVEVRCAASPVALSVDGRGVDLVDSTGLLSALRIANTGTATAENLQVSTLTLTDGSLVFPTLPHGLSSVAPDAGVVLDAEFSGQFEPLETHTLAAEGTYEAAGATFCFELDSTLEIPPAAPGSATTGTASVEPQTISGAPFATHPPQFTDAVNPPLWIVPTAPPVPVDPTDTDTGDTPIPSVLASATADPFAFQANNTASVVFEANTGGINGGSTASTSTTAEPSGASDGGGTVFVTGNWFAAYSTDGGASFTPVNPTSVFPSDTVGFCCDQLVQYVPSIDRFIWLLQGSTNATQLGGYRLAAASPADLASSGATAWTYWNLTPTLFGQPAGTGFDYPDMSVGTGFVTEGHLYLSWDAGFGCPMGCTQGFQVARIPLDEIENGGIINIRFTDPANGSMAWGSHIAQNPADEIFWAGHNNNSEMRVFTWAENSNTYFWRDVGISSWSTSGLSSTTPDGQDWMNKLSGFPNNAPHGLTRNGSALWFAWSAGTDDNFPEPHIEMVTLDESNDFDVLQQVQIWNQEFAFGYPALSTNACTFEIGLSLEYGGNDRYENHAVGFWGDFVVYRTTSSDVGTMRYGDYVGIRREPPNEQNPGNLFAAFGYGLNSSNGGTQVDVHYVSFGRPASGCIIIE